MKKIFFVSSLLATTYSFGQPVLGDSALPHEGTKFLQYTQPTISWGWTYKGRDTGANVTWDFDFVSYSVTPLFQIFDKPEDISINYEADTSNLARGNTNSYVCSWADSSGLRTVEVRFTNGVKYYYPIPEIVIPTPLNFREIYSDTCIERKGRNSTDTMRMGYKKITKYYDGYGTLKLGGKTFSNVARLRSDIVVFLVEETDTNRFLIQDFDWYSNTLGIQVFKISKVNYLNVNEDDSGSLIYDTSFSSAMAILYDTTSLSGMPVINNRPDHFKVFMKGSSLVIRNEGEDKEAVIYELIDAGGKTLESGKERIGSKSSEEIDVSAYKKGIYFLRLTGKEGQAESHKIILK